MFEVVRLPRCGSDYPITIAETLAFERQSEGLLSRVDRDELIDHIALHPECGVLIPGTGGLRKLRWRGVGKGKSKGLRVVYFYHDLNMPLFLLAAYSKGEILRLTKREERAMSKLAEELKRQFARKWEDGSASGSSA